MPDRKPVRDELIRFLGTIARPGQTLQGVEDTTNLVDDGVIDSLAMVQIIVHLEQAHGIDLIAGGIDPMELSTIGGILGSIERAAL